MNRQLVHLQNNEDRYEQSANRAVQFLLFIKTSRVPQIKNNPSQLLSVITEIQMTTGKRQVGIDECVKLMSTPVLHTSVCVTHCVSYVLHISRVMSDRVWVSDYHMLILTDTTGDTIHRVTDITTWYGGEGQHTVNSSGELIYINSGADIKKMSTDNQTVIRLIQKTSPWRPDCVYRSPSTGDLMVGMYNTNKDTGKVTRYSSSGKHILTIEHDNTGHMLYCGPLYITENKNGDIIVSDLIDYKRGAVVVTEREGRHRFSYTGPPSGSSLNPRGICTDALSHILVCDDNTHTVQMIDKDGHFLSLLLTPQHGIHTPRSLNFDDKTHLLWVGSYNTVSVYRYLQRRYSLTDYLDSEEEHARGKSYPDDADARGKADDEDVSGKSNTDDKDARGKSDTDDKDARGRSDSDDEDASGESDSYDEDARGKSDTDDKDARGNSDTGDEDARSKADPKTCCQRCILV
ncbi:uncharacterized protein LOC125666247 [Ostrea edulis]|uniref:uncharacterized protein LOC125666247 n=1 Tax=Ostrea edulis TaxID=37623 RepID=UPI0024AFF3BD|nr:uncharacterized protein LOC125666247 [Ostrea edulis]